MTTIPDDRDQPERFGKVPERVTMARRTPAWRSVARMRWLIASSRATSRASAPKARTVRVALIDPAVAGETGSEDLRGAREHR